MALHDVAGSQPLSGWFPDGNATWTRTADTTFTVTGDQTEVFSKGTRVRWTQTTVKYGVVVASSHAAGTTTVTLASTTAYALTAAAISDNYYSYAVNPQGYPGVFDWTSTEVGWAATPTQETSFSIVGKMLTMIIRVTGTSDSTSTTLTTPFTITGGSAGLYIAPVFIQNNGANNVGRVYLSSSTQLTFGLTPVSDTWTASGVKTVIAIYTIPF